MCGAEERENVKRGMGVGFRFRKCRSLQNWVESRLKRRGLIDAPVETAATDNILLAEPAHLQLLLPGPSPAELIEIRHTVNYASQWTGVGGWVGVVQVLLSNVIKLPCSNPADLLR